jgi:hypothetical protein
MIYDSSPVHNFTHHCFSALFRPVRSRNACLVWDPRLPRFQLSAFEWPVPLRNGKTIDYHLLISGCRGILVRIREKRLWSTPSSIAIRVNHCKSYTCECEIMWQCLLMLRGNPVVLGYKSNHNRPVCCGYRETLNWMMDESCYNVWMNRFDFHPSRTDSTCLQNSHQNSKAHGYTKPFRTTLVQLTDKTHLPCLPDSVIVARNDYSHNTSSLNSLWIITGFGTLKTLVQIQIIAHHLLFLMCTKSSNDVTTR